MLFLSLCAKNLIKVGAIYVFSLFELKKFSTFAETKKRVKNALSEIRHLFL